MSSTRQYSRIRRLSDLTGSELALRVACPEIGFASKLSEGRDCRPRNEECGEVTNLRSISHRQTSSQFDFEVGFVVAVG